MARYYTLGLLVRPTSSPFKVSYPLRDSSYGTIQHLFSGRCLTMNQKMRKIIFLTTTLPTFMAASLLSFGAEHPVIPGVFKRDVKDPAYQVALLSLAHEMRIEQIEDVASQIFTLRYNGKNAEADNLLTEATQKGVFNGEGTAYANFLEQDRAIRQQVEAAQKVKNRKY